MRHLPQVPVAHRGFGGSDASGSTNTLGPLRIPTPDLSRSSAHPPIRPSDHPTGPVQVIRPAGSPNRVAWYYERSAKIRLFCGGNQNLWEDWDRLAILTESGFPHKTLDPGLLPTFGTLPTCGNGKLGKLGKLGNWETWGAWDTWDTWDTPVFPIAPLADGLLPAVPFGPFEFTERATPGFVCLHVRIIVKGISNKLDYTRKQQSNHTFSPILLHSYCLDKN